MFYTKKRWTTEHVSTVYAMAARMRTEELSVYKACRELHKQLPDRTFESIRAKLKAARSKGGK